MAHCIALPNLDRHRRRDRPAARRGYAYADKLRQAGVKVGYKLYSSVTHAFFGKGAVVPKAREAEQYAADALKKAFEGKH